MGPSLLLYSGGVFSLLSALDKAVTSSACLSQPETLELGLD